jgi:hypothetical protein
MWKAAEKEGSGAGAKEDRYQLDNFIKYSGTIETMHDDSENVYNVGIEVPEMDNLQMRNACSPGSDTS